MQRLSFSFSSCKYKMNGANLKICIRHNNKTGLLDKLCHLHAGEVCLPQVKVYFPVEEWTFYASNV